MPTPVRFPGGVTNNAATDPLGQMGILDPTKFIVDFDDFHTYAAGDWTVTETQAGATQQFSESARGRLGKYSSGQAYQNYIDPTLKGWTKAYYGENYDRLVQVKTQYDPHDRLSFKQGIKPSRKG